MQEIHNDLKPLSANLKRIKIGEILQWKEFEYIMEENYLDNTWEFCLNEWSQNNRLYAFEGKDRKYTESYIIALNYAYEYYLRSNNPMDSYNYQQSFNLILKHGLIFYLKSRAADEHFNRIIEISKKLFIVKSETIDNIKKQLGKIDFNDNVIKQNVKMSVNIIKKYQIFISSTYIDLKEERQAAVEAILKKGHIPAGMELFAANDKSQWEVIKKWIDDSDIYLLLLGGRYGSIDTDTGLSYTEMEYQYALKSGKPIFALILADELLDCKPMEIIKDYDIKDIKYKNFKSVVSSKMCSFPKSLDQIKLDINHSLDDIIRDNQSTLIGWTRAAEISISEKKK